MTTQSNSANGFTDTAEESTRTFARIGDWCYTSTNVPVAPASPARIAPPRIPKSVLVARSWYDERFAAGVSEVANLFGWQVTLLDRHGNNHWFLPRRIDGAITIIDNEACNRDLIPRLNAMQVPVVNGLIGEIQGLHTRVARVVPDNHAIGRAAARHLHESGHRHLVCYRWKDNEIGKLRSSAFHQEALRLGCKVHDFPLRGLDDSSWLTAALDGLPRPIAVFCVCDEIAVMLTDVCRELGILVPEHLAVMGADNQTLLCLGNQPPLTSIDTAEREQGRQSALLLDQLMRGQDPPRQPVLIQPIGISSRASSLHAVVGNDQFSLALDYLRNNLAQMDVLARVTKEFSISRSTLYRLFVQFQGRPPAEELLRVRIERAQQLLATTDLGIAKIAELSGLRDASRLCRVFKNQTGRTPGDYRRDFQGRRVST